MGAFQLHTLGGVDLADTTSYHVPWKDAVWTPEDMDRYVPLRSANGAVLVYARQGRMTRQLRVWCHGANYGTAEVRRQAIETELTNARNSGISGTTVTYRIQDVSQGTPDTWKVIGGRWKPEDELRARGYVVGTLVLELSRT